MMLYFKSILAGLVTLFLSAIAFTVVQVFRTLRAARTEAARLGAAEVGIDIVALFKTPLFLIVVLIGVGIGFWWRFRTEN